MAASPALAFNSPTFSSLCTCSTAAQGDSLRTGPGGVPVAGAPGHTQLGATLKANTLALGGLSIQTMEEQRLNLKILLGLGF